MQNEIVTISADELSMVEDNQLNEKQLQFLLKKTPPRYVKSRPAKGGGEWLYVSGGYVKKVLNLMFGWDWDFEIIKSEVNEESKEVIVLGRLTCRANGKQIVKMQYGNKDIAYRRADSEGNRKPLSIGNDLKAASTDALKKCASEIGIASDIYNADEFREVNVDVEQPNKERDRIIKHIQEAKTIEQLEQVPETYLDDDEIQDLIMEATLRIPDEN